MNGLTLLGDPILILGLGFAGIVYGWVKSSYHLASAFGFAMVAYAFGGLLKEFIHRTRPDTVYVTAMKFKSYSFPSAHALGATIIFGLLAYLAHRNLPPPWNLVCPGLLLGLIFLIGVSRIYLGAHYPSDVIGGWLLGSAVLFLIVKYALH
jgi:undecaprenyl-diphosphatase